MFAFTKKQKQRKLYDKSLELYDKLQRELSAQQPLGSDEVAILTYDTYNLELEKLAINFDAVRDSIEDIDQLRSEKDVWKLQKTPRSEGKAYYLGKYTDLHYFDPDNACYHLASRRSNAAQRYTDAIAAMTGKNKGLVRHVRKPIVKKLKKLLAKVYSDVYDKHEVTVTDPIEYGLYLDLLKGIEQTDYSFYIYRNECSHYGHGFIDQLCKKLKTNIVIIDD